MGERSSESSFPDLSSGFPMPFDGGDFDMNWDELVNSSIPSTLGGSALDVDSIMGSVHVNVHTNANANVNAGAPRHHGVAADEAMPDEQFAPSPPSHSHSRHSLRMSANAESSSSSSSTIDMDGGSANDDSKALTLYNGDASDKRAKATLCLQEDGRVQDRPIYVMKCILCDRLHTSFSKGQECYYSHLRPYRCYIPRCAERFENEEQLRTHYKACHSRSSDAPHFYCDHCGDALQTPAEGEEHLKRHREEMASYDVCFQCAICSKNTIRQQDFLAHLSTHMSVVTAESVVFPDALPDEALIPELLALRNQQRRSSSSSSSTALVLSSSNSKKAGTPRGVKRGLYLTDARSASPMPSDSKELVPAGPPSKKWKPAASGEPSDAVLLPLAKQQHSQHQVQQQPAVPAPTPTSRSIPMPIHTPAQPPRSKALPSLDGIRVQDDDDEDEEGSGASDADEDENTDKKSTNAKKKKKQGSPKKERKERKIEEKKFLCTACLKFLAREKWAKKHANKCSRYKEYLLGKEPNPHRIHEFPDHANAKKFLKKIQECMKARGDVMSLLNKYLPPNQYPADGEEKRASASSAAPLAYFPKKSPLTLLAGLNPSDWELPDHLFKKTPL